MRKDTLPFHFSVSKNSLQLSDFVIPEHITLAVACIFGFPLGYNEYPRVLLTDRRKKERKNGLVQGM